MEKNNKTSQIVSENQTYHIPDQNVQTYHIPDSSVTQSQFSQVQIQNQNHSGNGNRHWPQRSENGNNAMYIATALSVASMACAIAALVIGNILDISANSISQRYGYDVLSNLPFSGATASLQIGFFKMCLVSDYTDRSICTSLLETSGGGAILVFVGGCVACVAVAANLGAVVFALFKRTITGWCAVSFLLNLVSAILVIVGTIQETSGFAFDIFGTSFWLLMASCGCSLLSLLFCCAAEKFKHSN